MQMLIARFPSENEGPKYKILSKVRNHSTSRPVSIFTNNREDAVALTKGFNETNSYVQLHNGYDLP